MLPQLDPTVRQLLQRGVVIPASPLALNGRRQLDERRQRALWRYYSAAGAGGIAVAVHTTQFAIREAKVGLLCPVLALAAEEFSRIDAGRPEPLVRIAGVCGRTEQAVAEAALAHELGFHAGLLGLGALRDAGEDALLDHCRAVAEAIPLVGFYLQPAVGGRVLPYAFWRRFLEIENLTAIKIAAFNRYQTLDVVRAVAESGRDDVALYTGNDDNIVLDLVTPYVFPAGGRLIERRFVGGLLGHWAVWTRRAVELLDACHAATQSGKAIPVDLLRRAVEVTDANAALFDAANGFAGCIAGLHEVLRRQGLLEGIWCLDPDETLSPGQRDEIDRICRMYPHLADDAFVAEHRDEWLAD
jgi:dihydrodipicolinate synthase/N-acetylneuraminate lyase